MLFCSSLSFVLPLLYFSPFFFLFFVFLGSETVVNIIFIPDK
jgi:hypothetical protein